MNGLKTAPNTWQVHFAETVADMGAKRLRSEPNFYYFPDRDLYAMSYVDDMLPVGLQDSSDWFFAELSQLPLMKHVCEIQASVKDIIPWSSTTAGRFGHPPEGAQGRHPRNGGSPWTRRR